MNKAYIDKVMNILNKNKSPLVFLCFLAIGYFLLIVFTGLLTPINVVSSNSMFPTIAKGDIIIVRTSSVDNLNIGSIIVYKPPEPYPSPNIHRVIDKWIEGDTIYFKTQGDNVPYPDSYSIPSSKIIAEYTGIRIPFLGYMVLFLQTIQGIIIIFGIVAVWILYDGFIKNESGT